MIDSTPSPATIPAPLLAARTDKKRPVQLFQCAACNKNIADEAVPIAVRVSAFVVPQATRDRLDPRGVPFDITDVGLPQIVRELVDDSLHPDGHVYMGLGCFVQALGLSTFNADGLQAPIAPRERLDILGIPNDAFTGREHREPSAPTSPVELFDKNGNRVNPDGSLWVPQTELTPAPELEPSADPEPSTT